MKPDQQQQAQNLYFQTDLSMTDIAEAVGVSRRTLHYWIQQNNWDRLKQSARFIPSYLAENCYQVLGRFTEALLSEERKGQAITYQEANTLYKLTLTINKLKNGPALNDSMETLAWFSERVGTKDAKLAQQLQPHIDEFISDKAQPHHKKYQPSQLTEEGYMPQPAPQAVKKDEELDAFDRFQALTDEIMAEGEEATSAGVTVTSSPAAPPSPSVAAAMNKVPRFAGAAAGKGRNIDRHRRAA